LGTISWPQGVLVLTTFTSYRLITSDLPRSLAAIARKPQVARETDYYLERIGEVKSIDDFLADNRLFTYAMKAFGLGEMTYAKAFIRKALTEGIDDPQSFANQLSDQRYRDFVSTFNFARYGTATTSFERTRQGTVDKYVRQMLEEDAGSRNEGVRLALYFQRKAPLLKSAYGILADRALLAVVQTALGLPPATALADIDLQAEMISRRLDIEEFKDPNKLQRFIARFLSLWELTNPGTQANSPAVSAGWRAGVGITPSLLASLQNLQVKGS
jgi:hypothetical protein